MKDFKSYCIKAVLLVAAIVVVGALFGLGNEMGYCIVFYYGVFPACMIVWSFRLRAEPVKLKLAYILLAAVLGYIMPWFIFGRPWYLIAIVGTIGAVIGTVFGIFEYSAEKKLENKEKDSSD